MKSTRGDFRFALLLAALIALTVALWVADNSRRPPGPSRFPHLPTHTQP